MGAFFSNIQLRNDTERDKFLEAFNNIMKSNGFEPCTEEDAEQSYRLLFSDRFVTLLRYEYNADPNALDRDAKLFSSELKADLFTVTVVDSDFAMLTLYSGRKPLNNALAGDGEGYGVTAEADPKLWQLLLTEGKTFEELSEIWNDDTVFAEDTLYSSGELFGITPLNMAVAFDEAGRSEYNALTLDFCRVRQKGALKMSKKLTLNAAIKNIFSEALEPPGFKRFKGNLFIRAIGGEILQVINFSSEQAFTTYAGANEKAFAVHGGMTSLYATPESMTADILFSPTRFNDLATRYSKLYPEKHGDEDWKEMYRTCYNADDSADIRRAASLALKHTEKILLPLFQQVTDLNSYLMTQRRLGVDVRIPTPESIRDPERLRRFFDMELIYIGLPYRGDFKELIKDSEEYDRIASILDRRGINHFEYKAPYSEYCIKECSGAEMQRRALDKVLGDRELCGIVERELERRKGVNVEALRGMGIELG